MYENILKAAIKFEKLAQDTANPNAASTLPGGIGAYQDLLSGYKAWSKFTKGQNLIGVDVSSKQLIPENPVIQHIIKLMGSKPGKINVGLKINPDGNVSFNVTGNHPAAKNIEQMLRTNLAPAMRNAIAAAVTAKAISLPSSEAPVNWNWITELAIA